MNPILFITSGIISLSIYLLIIIALVFTLFYSPIHYSDIKESSISLNAISIEAIIDDANLKSNQDKKATSNSPLAGSGIKDMFDRIDSETTSQKEPIGDNREKIEQNVKEQKVQDLHSATQEIQNKLLSLSNLTISTNNSQNDGEYDQWYAQIEKIMHQQWQKTFYVEDKLQALVHIRISENGIFSYKVVKYSGDVAFDDSLKTMLEECTQIHFPPHPKGKKEIATTFKN